MPIAGRHRGWLDSRVHERFRARLAAVSERRGVAVPVYCLMPDHLHILAAGTTAQSDQQLWYRALRQDLNELLRPHRLGQQASDQIVRLSELAPEPFGGLVAALLALPSQAGLVKESIPWPYCGCCIPAMRGLDVYSPNYLSRWWGYWQLVTSFAARPPPQPVGCASLQELRHSISDAHRCVRFVAERAPAAAQSR